MSLLVAALLLVSDPSTQTAPATEAAKPAKEPKICKVDPARTGSHMQKRICLTASEWEQKNQSKDVSDLKSAGTH
jgi:hypothetical protein